MKLADAAQKAATRPLSGRRILITRAPHQASALADHLTALGATPVLIPTIEIAPPSSFAALDAALASLANFDLIAFTSANAVEAFQQRAQQLNRKLAPNRIAAVGPATARALAAIGLHADIIPTTFTAEALARTIVEALEPEIAGRILRILLVLAEAAPATLQTALAAASASLQVTVAAAYSNRIPADSLAAIATLFAEASRQPDAITFTSASTARNLAGLLEAAQLTLPETVLRASIGPITSQALRELGLPPHCEAAESTIPSLVATLVETLAAAPVSTAFPHRSPPIDPQQHSDTVEAMGAALLTTDLSGLPLLARGKVRDLYALPDDLLLFVATDRISAFDHVLGSGIPDKGKILTQLSAFWFAFLADTVQNHLLPHTPPAIEALLGPFAAQLAGRSMVVRRARMFPVECVVRGYLSGSGWKDYQASSALGQPAICGIALPAGLRESDRLPEPIFTPAAKVNTGGHDENIAYTQMEAIVGADIAAELRRLTFAIYAKAAAYAATKGLILADTKFEFGEVDGHIVLADEVLTPDSSRYWPAASYAPGGAQPSFDKQYVRDFLESIHWNKQAPAPALPDNVVERTREKYLEAFRLLTGQSGLGLAPESEIGEQTQASARRNYVA